MAHLCPRRVGWILALTLELWAPAAQAEAFRYHYVSLTSLGNFAPSAINESGSVYGTAFFGPPEKLSPFVAMYADGAETVLQPGTAVTANARGTIGGYITNPGTGQLQAALFRGTELE